MTDTTREEPTLGALLLSLSDRLTDAEAAIACGVGISGAAAIALLAPGWWRLALASLALASFGAWIVLERNESHNRWQDLGQRLSVVVGTACAFLLGLSVLTLALGTWIS